MTKTIFEIDKNMKNNDLESIKENNVTFYNLNNDYLLGQAFRNDFKRLENIHVSDNVDILKKHPSGLNIIFQTDSKNIKLKAKLAGPAYMSHMTSVGTIGFSLYVLNKDKWAFLGATKVLNKEYTANMISNMDKKMRTYRIYFPLYQELIDAYVGVDEKAKFEFVKPKMDKLYMEPLFLKEAVLQDRVWTMAQS